VSRAYFARREPLKGIAMKLLRIDASILGDQSTSREMTAAITAAFTRREPTLSVTAHDLAADPVGHLTGPEFFAMRGAPSEGEENERNAARNAAILEDFLAADIVVVGAPMYNFSLPSQLKAWFDRLAVAGRTFQYTEAGPQGLLAGKRVIVASSRGGIYHGGPAIFLDHQESYLKALFGFFGISEVEFIRAEGIGRGPEARTEALAAAAVKIEKLVA
jgi:FMN-dependent NADH-azoreductase